MLSGIKIGTATTATYDDVNKTSKHGSSTKTRNCAALHIAQALISYYSTALHQLGLQDFRQTLS